MALNVQIVDMKSDDFSPMDLYGYNKYQMGDLLTQQSGFNPSLSPYLNQNVTFNQIFAADRQGYQQFVNEIEMIDVNPFNEAGEVEYWEDISEMTNISQANHLNLITYAPVRQLILEERISGFGYDPASIPDEDIIGRMINNGRAYIKEDGSYERSMTKYSDDLNYSDKQLRKFDRQRDMVDLVLASTNLDPTDTKLERF